VLIRLKHFVFNKPRYLFQPFNHTALNRYPYLFQYARDNLAGGSESRILSFGCSTGEEVFTLRDYFPLGFIKGVDINPRNIAKCRRRLRNLSDDRIVFELNQTRLAEPAGFYDAIFCMAVFTHGRLATSRAKRCTPVIRFADFESVMGDLARCLKLGGPVVSRPKQFQATRHRSTNSSK
jgi:SAM-dependent methyltransferase